MTLLMIARRKDKYLEFKARASEANSAGVFFLEIGARRRRAISHWNQGKTVERLTREI